MKELCIKDICKKDSSSLKQKELKESGRYPVYGERKVNVTDDLKEQQRIVSRLDSLSAHVRELEEVLQKTIAECDALKQALLRQVFE